MVLDKLTAYLNNNDIEFSQEAYALNWLGKSYAKARVYDDNPTFLAAHHAHNQQHPNSQNLLIQGDNLAVLKHLQEAYREQVKMIYIDPPYNTGSDGFVYCDDRKYTAAQISAMTGEDEDTAERIFSFINRQSSSHSAWLTFMYPRLKIARELLREDGVIFISIDDNEQAQLKMLCDEVFGEENFVGSLKILSNPRGRHSSNHFATSGEYVLVFSKNIEDAVILGEELSSSQLDSYNKEDDIGKFREIGLRKRGSDSKKEDSPTLFFPIYFNPDLNIISLEENKKTVKIIPKLEDGEYGRWRWSRSKIIKDMSLLYCRKVKRGGRLEFDIFEKDYLTENKKVKSKDFWTEKDINYDRSSEEIRGLFSSKVFDFAKPLYIINKILKITTNYNDLILDFFAGSGTTAHAVMQLNAEDGGNRRYICVQLDEKTDPKSEAYKAGYQTIFDITKARIEKAAVKIREEHPDYQGDLGFQEFKLIDYPQHYGAKPDNPQQGELLAELDLDKTTLQAILSTWCVNDGLPLTEQAITLDLGDYTAYHAQRQLYLLDKGFNSQHLAEILRRLDDVKNPLNIERIVVLGHHFDSKTQRELAEAVNQYKPRKGNQLYLAVRYE